MNGFDVLVFTGGVGENFASIRKQVCLGMEFLGLYFDDDKNIQTKLSGFEAAQLQLDNSRIKVLVMQAGEELIIFKEARYLLTGK